MGSLTQVMGSNKSPFPKGKTPATGTLNSARSTKQVVKSQLGMNDKLKKALLATVGSKSSQIATANKKAISNASELNKQQKSSRLKTNGDSSKSPLRAATGKKKNTTAES